MGLAAASGSGPQASNTEAGITLKGVRFQLARGQLLGICGEVGAGKSSVLAALLGELLPLQQQAGSQGADDRRGTEEGLAGPSGAPCMLGEVAYCQQVPWVVAGSVRDNIVFGKPFDEQFYNKVLAACALDADIAMLPAGDATELGERGINLSGGQKARVALARACYSRHSVQLMDDPLSAVDPRVGRVLFEQAVVGLMAGSTRVLVTHQRQYLPQCDLILVLRAGQVAALGTWAQVSTLGFPELTHGPSGVEVSVDEAMAGLEEQRTAIPPQGPTQAMRVGEGAAGEVQGPRGGGDEDAGQSGLGLAAATGVAPHAEGLAEGRRLRTSGEGAEVGGTAKGQGAKGGEDGDSLQCGSGPGPVSAAAARAEGSGPGLDGESNTVIAAPSEVAVDLSPALRGDRGAEPTAATSGAGPGEPPSDAAGPAVVPPPPPPPQDIPSLPPAAGPAVPCARQGSSLGTPRGGGGSVGSFSRVQSLSRFLLSRNRTFFAPGRSAPRPKTRAETGEQFPVFDENDDGAGAQGGRGGFLRNVSMVFSNSMARLLSRRGRTSSYKEQGQEEEDLEEREKEQAASAAKAGKLVRAERRQEGDVPWRVYLQYMYSLGTPATTGVWILLLGGQAASVASDWWLAMWARASNQAQLSWVWVYGLLVGIVLLVALPRSALFFHASVKAASTLHDVMALRVMRAPLSFFHTNPVGRVLNRFSRDLGIIDDLLPMTLFDALQCSMVVIGAFLLVTIAVPFILPVFLPLIAIFYYVRTRYIAAAREVKRWEAVTRSPVYAFFTQSIKGLPTIRAYAASQRFHQEFLGLLSLNNAWCYAIIATARWVGFRLDVICACTLTATALLAVATQSGSGLSVVKPQLLGLALTYIMSIMGVMQWFVRQTAEVENNMTSVERLLEYTVLPQEPPMVGEEGGDAPPAGWPQSGELTFEEVTATYRAGLPPVLRGVSFHLAAGASCGLVGRTGSGKSSLMLALFRLISIDSGRILLSGLDTTKVGLDALRRQLAIIPQDPVLFSGTIRGNLDPWGQQQDHQMWEALEAVQLKGVVQDLPGGLGLDSRMAEAGDNLSVGQRQLFCLARALLQDARVLALDEATASVDGATDALIQQAVRRFAKDRLSCDGPGGSSDGSVRADHGRVLLVIAHRIDTIIDMDQILVLGSGRVLENGRPSELVAAGGTFAGMVAASRVRVPH